MEASGQLHAPDTLPPEKELPVHIGQEDGWATEPSWKTWTGQNPALTGTPVVSLVIPTAVYDLRVFPYYISQAQLECFISYGHQTES
jgi:hypothetical protein